MIVPIHATVKKFEEYQGPLKGFKWLRLFKKIYCVSEGRRDRGQEEADHGKELVIVRKNIEDREFRHRGKIRVLCLEEGR